MGDSPIKRWLIARRIRQHRIDDALWCRIVADSDLFDGLGPVALARVRDLAARFIAEKRFFGACGFFVDDTVRAAIAAQACRLVVNLGFDYLAACRTVIVYEGGFVAEREVEDEDGIVHAVHEELDGEAAHGGAVVLAWDEAYPRRNDPNLPPAPGVPGCPSQKSLQPGSARGYPSQRSLQPGSARGYPSQESLQPGSARGYPSQESLQPGSARGYPSQENPQPGSARGYPSQQKPCEGEPGAGKPEAPAEGRYFPANVVIHEFAHKLDELSGHHNGLPPLPESMSDGRWPETFSTAYASLCDSVERGLEPPIDDYGASDPAEFFAVTVETFFTGPDILFDGFPKVYALLTELFQENPLGTRRLP